MRDATKTLDAILALLLLTVMLVGSPLSSFGCQTVAPDHLQMPCETNLGGTAVQSNFVQPVTTVLTLIVVLTVICWLNPQHRTPQELYLLPPAPPPRDARF
ncbi:MAG: hypothetical protein IPJ90_23295 [Anaerolineaceae bacterium]|nr:hypothetical protein [Anaerolineaceae bacterium]